MQRNERLYPSWKHMHYYGLVQLRKKIVQVLDKYFDHRNDYIFLDYGCGSKPYEELYKKVSAHYLGADLKENELADIFIDRDTGRIEIENNYADCVISTQVLEHVESPMNYLREAHRVCKEGGLLIISTHGFFPYHPDPEDYWRWTASGLKKILNESGWEAIEINGIIGQVGVGLSFIQYSLTNRIPKILRVTFRVFMQRVIALSDKIFHRGPMSKLENCVLYLIVAKRK